MHPLEIERAAIVKKIENHGTIPTTTTDTRCNKKKYVVNPRGNIMRYGHKCDGGELGDLRKGWTKRANELKKELEEKDKEIHDEVPTRSEKHFQDALDKIKAAEQAAAARKYLQNLLSDDMRKNEPLQILNEIQHIKPQIIETPIQEKSFIDKNKNYLIIGGFAITTLVLFLILWRRK